MLLIEPFCCIQVNNCGPVRQGVTLSKLHKASTFRGVELKLKNQPHLVGIVRHVHSEPPCFPVTRGCVSKQLVQHCHACGSYHTTPPLATLVLILAISVRAWEWTSKHQKSIEGSDQRPIKSSFLKTRNMNHLLHLKQEDDFILFSFIRSGLVVSRHQMGKFTSPFSEDTKVDLDLCVGPPADLIFHLPFPCINLVVLSETVRIQMPKAGDVL